MTVNAIDGPQPLKSLSSLRDGLLVFTVLAFIALFNVGLHWEIQNITKRSIDFQAAEILQLDEAQIRRIYAIQIAYDLELIRLKREHNFPGADKIDQLLGERDKDILKELTTRQQQMLYKHCQDLVSVTQMFKNDLMQ